MKIDNPTEPDYESQMPSESIATELAPEASEHERALAEQQEEQTVNRFLAECEARRLRVLRIAAEVARQLN